jgi:protein gp37
MSDKSGIEWTDATWNPVTGCTKVSPGCDHCYAETLAERFRGTPGHYYENGFDVQLRPDKLDLPLRWTKPRRVFVNSMSDLFHDQVPDEYIAQVFAVMALADRHTFQLLTKRHGRMRSLLNNTGFRAQVATFVIERAEQAPGPPHIPMRLVLPSDGREWWPLLNVWLGVSVEDQHWANIRIPALLDTPAEIRFLSCEPLLGPVSLFANTRLDTGTLVDWVIVGGESGRGARPMLPAWARGLRYECTTHGIPFLFKQWGEWSPCGSLQPDGSIDWNDPTAGMERLGKKAAGRELDGRTWDEYPQAVTTS